MYDQINSFHRMRQAAFKYKDFKKKKEVSPKTGKAAYEVPLIQKKVKSKS